MATSKKPIVNATQSKRVFISHDYKYRLRLLREIISGENQADFAERIGVPFKRWNTYERGYPIPRETAMLLIEQFDGISVEWLWYGMTGNMSEAYLKKIQEVEALHREQEASAHLVEQAKAKLEELKTKLKKVSGSPKPPRRTQAGGRPAHAGKS